MRGLLDARLCRSGGKAMQAGRGQGDGPGAGEAQAGQKQAAGSCAAPAQMAAGPSRLAASSAALSRGCHSSASARALGLSSDTGPDGGGTAAAEKACQASRRGAGV